jgi:hypothetical protein
MGPPVPPGDSTGMNKELPGQCVKACFHLTCGKQIVRGVSSWEPHPDAALESRYGERMRICDKGRHCEQAKEVDRLEPKGRWRWDVAIERVASRTGGSPQPPG